MMVRLAAKPKRDWLGRLAVIALAALCGAMVIGMPDWERQLHAQGYLDILGVLDQALEETRRDKEAVAARLDSAKDKANDPPRGIWLVFDRDALERRNSGDQDFDARQPGFLLGFDYRLRDDLVIGAVAGWKYAAIDYLSTQRDIIRTVNVGPYGRYYPPPCLYCPTYIDLALMLGILHIDTHEKTDGVPYSGATNGYSLATLGRVGKDWEQGRWTYGPVLTIEYDIYRIQGFHEKLDVPASSLTHSSTAASVPFLFADILTIRPGARIQYTLPFFWGQLTPQATLSFGYRDWWESQPTTALADFSGLFDHTFMEGSVGMQAGLPENWSVWANYRRTFLDRFLQFGQATLGVRKEF